MSKRKPFDKVQARERRNRMVDAAAAAELSLTEGVREMRAIANMTQEEFARHRGVSARVIKAIELGQGNPTVATLNRIGQFFGLEVAFVPIRRVPGPAASADTAGILAQRTDRHAEPATAAGLNLILEQIGQLSKQIEALSAQGPADAPSNEDLLVRNKRKPRSG